MLGPQPFGTHDHQHHQHQAEHQHPVKLEVAEDLGQSDDDGRAQNDARSTLPIPPRITMASMLIDSCEQEVVGEDGALPRGEQAPANAGKAAPVANACSLATVVFTPMAWAASSSSRIACHAQPMRELRSRTEAPSSSARIGKEQVIVVDVASSVKPRNGGGSMRMMPLGPPVMFTGRSRLIRQNVDDLAETQRDDGQIVAAQSEGRRADQEARDRA